VEGSYDVLTILILVVWNVEAAQECKRVSREPRVSVLVALYTGEIEM
jgi:hypothetical protein